jgi:hypothetical protein
LFTTIKKHEKQTFSLEDKLILRKRSIIATINDQLKIYAKLSIQGIGTLVTPDLRTGTRKRDIEEV